jgi:hypothetical protein
MNKKPMTNQQKSALRTAQENAVAKALNYQSWRVLSKMIKNAYADGSPITIIIGSGRDKITMSTI